MPRATRQPEPCKPEPDGENNRRSPDDFSHGGIAEGKVVFLERDISRYAHDEHKERKYKVGRCQTVPRRMSQRSIYERP